MSEHDGSEPGGSKPTETTTLPLVAYEASSVPSAMLRPGPAKRAWMDATHEAFAYRCLPLVMANQLGWEALSPTTFSAIWHGGPNLDDVEILFADEPCPFIESHFGHGILTFKTGHLFRTPPGHNLWVQGPANRPKDGIAPLEGLVESDWGPFTFTANWQFTRPGHAIAFEEGEPFARIVPYPRGYAERFAPSIEPIGANPELQAEFEAWRASRDAFLEQMDVEGSEPHRTGWQKHYMLGTTPEGQAFADHARRMPLRAFARSPTEESP